MRSNGGFVSEIVLYIDDNRVVGCSPKESWLSLIQMAKGFYWLGLYDVPSKRR